MRALGMRPHTGGFVSVHRGACSPFYFPSTCEQWLEISFQPPDWFIQVSLQITDRARCVPLKVAVVGVGIAGDRGVGAERRNLYIANVTFGELNGLVSHLFNGSGLCCPVTPAVPFNIAIGQVLLNQAESLCICAVRVSFTSCSILADVSPPLAQPSFSNSLKFLALIHEISEVGPR